VRLLVRLELKGEATRHPQVSLRGQNGEVPQVEHLEKQDFQWGARLAVATSRMVYTSLAEIQIAGLEKRDRVSVSVMDFSAEDLTLFLPLLAGIPDSRRALNIVDLALFADDRFGGTFGFPVCPASPRPRSASIGQTVLGSFRGNVLIPWNILIGEGLLVYGLQIEAAVIQNLKQQHGFAHAYDAESGVGIGERNSLQGLAPLGLFLDTLGVRFESPRRVTLRGKNPFPWPITVKYRGLTVTRHADQTLVVFPNDQTLTLNDPTDAVITTG
jgi:hypothetical protein